MTADDVKFTLLRIGAEDSTNAQKALYAGIESVEDTGPHVVVKIKNPDGKFLWKLGWGDAVIVSPETRGHQQDQSRRHRPLPVQALGPGRPGRTGGL